MTQYNIIIELPIRNVDGDVADKLIDQFEEFHPSIGQTDLGWAEAVLTIEADSLRQALVTGLAIAGGNVVAIAGMTTEEFDRRPVDVDRMPELVSVTEAAEQLGISPQAVRQKLATGMLAGTKVGGTWWLPATGVKQK